MILSILTVTHSVSFATVYAACRGGQVKVYNSKTGDVHRYKKYIVRYVFK